jgi:hypothetical protein
VPTFLALLAIFAAAWPWFVLHGVARIVVGVVWTLFALLIAVAVVVSRRDVKPTGKPSTGTAGKPLPSKAETPPTSTDETPSTGTDGTRPLWEYKFSGNWTLSEARYTAPVRAVTPSGFTVTRPRCCEKGHATPDEAATHAAEIKAEVERRGR